MMTTKRMKMRWRRVRTKNIDLIPGFYYVYLLEYQPIDVLMHNNSPILSIICIQITTPRKLSYL
jgi:hypothetical protein